MNPCDMIIKLKNDKRYTAAELSQLSGVPKGTVDKILSGETKDPGASTFGKLLAALNGKKSVSESHLRMLGSIAAGAPVYANADAEEGVTAVGNAYGSDFSLTVKGDSMTGARILDGDIVFIKRMDDVDDGDIAAVMIDGEEATLKRVYHVPGGLQLISANPDYPPMLFTSENSDSLKIVGKAVGFQSRL